MGGMAVLVFGSLSAERLEPRPLPRTLFDRMLGRTRTVGPRSTPRGQGAEWLELDATDLKPLIQRFRAYLARELPTPHAASAQIVEYLELSGIPNLYLRAEREPGEEPNWYTQMAFSGCAGMAEVSALVGAHWAARWMQEELPIIEREIFLPFGFTPTPGQQLDPGEVFLPVAELGYLRLVPPEERDESGPFEVDHAVRESLEDTDERLAAGQDRYAAVMADGRCRCQLCQPAFDPVT
jgi:hypothetical protein